jgi:tetratricopeptide (TPR) repeat protein
MARTLTASRLRRYVGGLAAMSVVHPEPGERPTQVRSALRLLPRTERSGQAQTSDPEAIARAIEAAEELVGQGHWARAQRLLEDVTRQDHDREVATYLEEIRSVRRAQRQLLRRPRDASLHVELGRLYFGLEQGEPAAVEFRRAIELEPTHAEAHFYLALEYLFRDDEEASRECLAHAAELRPDVPSYETLLNLLWE